MPGKYTVVLDAGSSAIKCFIFNQKGEIVTSGTSDWIYKANNNASPYAFEFDTNATWGGICEMLTKTIRASVASPNEIVAITATSQRQTVVFLDSAGNEMFAGPNIDLRAIFEGGQIDEEIGTSVYEETGHSPSFLFATAKLKWFKNHRPQAYFRIKTVITIADWLLFKLSGNLVSEPSLACDSGLLNVKEKTWASKLTLNLPFERLGTPLVAAGNVVSPVTLQASKTTGLSTKTFVVISGADTQCGLLGMGIYSEFDMGIVAGWSVTLQAITENPILSKEQLAWTGCFLTENKWILESSTGDAGNSYNWLAKTLFSEIKLPFSYMDKLADMVPIGSDGVTTFLGPTRFDKATGMRTGGIILPVPLTFSEIGRGQIVRGVLESIAYAVRLNLEQVEKIVAAKGRSISVGGGFARSKVWVNILNNVLGRSISINNNLEVSAMGAYLCAQTAIGEFSSLEEAARFARKETPQIEPDPLSQSMYEDYFQEWTKTEKLLKSRVC